METPRDAIALTLIKAGMSAWAWRFCSEAER